MREPKPSKVWLRYTIVTILCWGIWGSLMEYPEKFGFPATLGYVTWAIMMVPCAYWAIKQGKAQIVFRKKCIIMGCSAGFLGAGGQLMLFFALKYEPAYMIFPIISLYPVLTIMMCTLFLKERTNSIRWIGIAVAMSSVFFMSYQESSEESTLGWNWLILSLPIFMMWGIQEFCLKWSQSYMNPESIFLYMTITALVLIPIALMMTDFRQEIHWGWKGPWLTAAIQSLNAIGALCLVKAFKTGQAILVTPLVALAPVITIFISLVLYGVVPHPYVLVGMLMACIAIVLIALEVSIKIPRASLFCRK